MEEFQVHVGFHDISRDLLPAPYRCWNDKAQCCGLPNGFQCGLLGQHLRGGTTELSGSHRGDEVCVFFLVSMGFPCDLKIGFLFLFDIFNIFVKI